MKHSKFNFLTGCTVDIEVWRKSCKVQKPNTVMPLFSLSRFQKIKHKRTGKHIYPQKIQSVSTFENVPTYCFLVSMVALMHKHTFKTRSNSSVCMHALCWPSTAMLWFFVLEWESDVIVALGFLSYWDEVMRGQHNLEFIGLPLPPLPLPCPKYATSLLQTFFFYWSAIHLFLLHLE